VPLSSISQLTSRIICELLEHLIKLQNYPDRHQPAFRIAVVTATKPASTLKNITNLTESHVDSSPAAAALDTLIHQMIASTAQFLRIVVNDPSPESSEGILNSIVEVSRKISKICHFFQ